MEGNRRFGMVEYDRGTGGMKSLGCEVEITQCDPLPDGRFHINVAGRRRIRILSSRVQDGYALATVRYLRDDDDDLVPCPDLTSIMRDSVRDALAEMETLEDDEYVKSLMSLVQNRRASLRKPRPRRSPRCAGVRVRHRGVFEHHAPVDVSSPPRQRRAAGDADAEELSWSLADTTGHSQGAPGLDVVASIATAREGCSGSTACVSWAHAQPGHLEKRRRTATERSGENGEDADDDMEEDGDVEEEEEEEEDVDEGEDEKEKEEEEEEGGGGGGEEEEEEEEEATRLMREF